MITRLFRLDEDILIPLSDKAREGTPAASISRREIWNRESKKVKIKALIGLKWSPSENLIMEIAKEIFLKEVFGLDNQLSSLLFDLMIWHYNQDIKLTSLNKSDHEKAKSLEAFTVLTRKSYCDPTSLTLKLALDIRAPWISLLLCPTVVKIPIRSIQYFVDIDIFYAFDSIRSSKHCYSDHITSYLYEIAFLQQKIAVSFHSVALLIDSIYTNKNISVLINDEVNAMIYIDYIVLGLKASIEKIIALIAYTFEIKNIEDKKTHKQKINVLKSDIPYKTQEQYYFEFILEHISSENLNSLNSHRTGIVHKKGLSKLQPHTYYEKNNTHEILLEFFKELHEQYSKNSAVFIASIALLTDKLVQLEPPTIKPEDLPCDKLSDIIQKLFNSGSKE